MNKTKLGEIAVSQTGPFGSQLHEEDYVEEGTPIVTVEHLGDIGFTSQNLPFVSEEDVQRLSKYTLEEGDIVFSRVGSIDRSVYTRKEQEGWLFSGRCIRVRCDKKKVNPRYLSYYFKLPEFKKMMLNISVGATMPSLNTKLMDGLQLHLLEKEEQDKIALFLDRIDSKILINNRINQELEKLSKLLYQFWFLQYEFPNDRGETYKNHGGSMEWSDRLKQQIPKNWKVIPLSSLISSSKNGDWGTEDRSEQTDIIVNCFRGADFPCITSDYLMSAPIRYIKEQNKDRILEDGDLVTEISGGSPTQSTGRVGYINNGFLNRTNNQMTCSNFCKAFTPKKKAYQYWLYQTWQVLYDSGAMFNFESKTTGIKNLMFDEFINNVYVALPDKNLLDEYQRTCEVYYDAIQKNLKQNYELAALRDFLLPMLMNGQLRIKE